MDKSQNAAASEGTMFNGLFAGCVLDEWASAKFRTESKLHRFTTDYRGSVDVYFHTNGKVMIDSIKLANDQAQPEKMRK